MNRITHSSSVLRLAALVCALGLAAAVPALAQSERGRRAKLDRAISEAIRAGKPVRAIVTFTDAGARERGRSRVNARGGWVRRSLNDVGGLSVVVDSYTAEELAADSGVAHISIDAEVRAGTVTAAPRAWRDQPATSYARHVSSRRRDRADAGIAVAVIDSGVQPHVDLPESRIRAFVDFVNGRSRPYDDFGHGTHVAGIVAGSGAASNGEYQGVAPDVDIVALKVLDANGGGQTSDVIAALEWVAANYRRYNIRVVNLSLGHPIFEPAATDPLVRAAQALVRRGIVVVASAGNMGIDPQSGAVGYGGITSPANGMGILAVGAVDDHQTPSRRDDRVARYSSRGPTRFDMRAKPDIVAVGDHVVSLAAPGSYLYDNYPALRVWAGRERQPAYMTLSGTSMAAPVVAGAAALVLAENPSLPAASVRMALEFTASAIRGTDNLVQGAGYLNPDGAVSFAAVIDPSRPQNAYWLASSTPPDPITLDYGEEIVWAKKIVWGESLLGGNAPYFHMASWDDNGAWSLSDESSVGDADGTVWSQCDDGDDDEDCHNVVWGNNVVWGFWADNVVWGFWDENVVWGNVTRSEAENVVWGNAYLEDAVQGMCEEEDCHNVVWGNNVVWGFSLAVLTGGTP